MAILSILIPVFSLVLVGFIYGRIFKPDMSALNQAMLFVFTPALVFDVMSASDFNLAGFRWLAIGSWLVVLGSGCLALIVCKVTGFRWRSFVPCMMFNNCGNLGLPLATLAFGETGLQAMVVMFIASNLLHFTLGVWMFGGAISVMAILFNPVNIATIAGLAVNIFDIGISPLIRQPVSLLGQIVIPMMLFSLGVRMVNVNRKHLVTGLAGGLVCPLSGLIPAVVLIQVLPLSGAQSAMLLLFSALPPAVLNFLFAEQYQRDQDDVASMVLVGNAVSVVVMAIVLSVII